MAEALPACSPLRYSVVLPASSDALPTNAPSTHGARLHERAAEPGGGGFVVLATVVVDDGLDLDPEPGAVQLSLEPALTTDLSLGH